MQENSGENVNPTLTSDIRLIGWQRQVQKRIGGDYSFCKLLGGNPFSYRKARSPCPAKEVDIKDLGQSGPSLFGFYVDFFEDTLFAIDGNESPKGIIHSFNDDLKLFETCQNDLELVLVESFLTHNSISILPLKRVKLLTFAVFQNPVNVHGPYIRNMTILQEADVILNKVFVLAPFDEEKMIDIVPGGRKNGLRKRAKDDQEQEYDE